MIKKRFYYIKKLFLINFHKVFIYVYGRRVNTLLSDGNIVLSKKLLDLDRLLNYHCNKVLILEQRIAL